MKTQLKKESRLVGFPFFVSTVISLKIKSKIPCDFTFSVSPFFKDRTGKTEYHSCPNVKSHPWTGYTWNPKFPFWPPADNKDSVSGSHQTLMRHLTWACQFHTSSCSPLSIEATTTMTEPTTPHVAAVLFRYTQQQSTRKNDQAYDYPCDGSSYIQCRTVVVLSVLNITTFACNFYEHASNRQL